MLYGTRDRFDYLECNNCGTLQLLNIPDLSKYYPKDYYSFNSKSIFEDNLLLKAAANRIGKHIIENKSFIGKLLNARKPQVARNFLHLLMDSPFRVDLQSRILDYGSGNGALLYGFKAFGFRNLTGADPFIEKEESKKGLKILKKDISELEPEFDLIILHHSFEHIPDPDHVLSHINRLLSKNGVLIIGLPIVGWGWKVYKTNWFPLDPPRHIFIYNEKSLADLVGRFGMKIIHAKHDLHPFTLPISELYSKDISPGSEVLCDPSALLKFYTVEKLAELEAKRKNHIENNETDQAVFYIVRNQSLP